MKLSKSEIRSKYDSFASKYDKFEGIAEFFIIGKIRREFLNKVYGKVLDVGIGTGKNLKYYSKNCNITGLDYSREMLKISKLKARKLNLNVKLIVGDAEKLPFRGGEFDYVVDTLGLCTYSNPIKALKEMKRVCKKNGRILLLEHGISTNRLIRGMQNIMKKNHYKRLGCNVARDHHKLAEKAGLKIVRYERKFFGIIYLIEAVS